MTQRSAWAVVAAALVATLAAGCGGTSRGVSAAGSTQTHAATTTQTTGRHSGGGQTTGGRTTGGRTTGGHTTTRPTGSTRPGGSSKGAQGRPLVRLATACRSLPQPPSGAPRRGKSATEALALRLSARVRVMLQALGPARPKTPATQFLAPLRHTLIRLRKAAQHATTSPTARAAQALHEAAAGMSAAAQQIGVPECALGSG